VAESNKRTVVDAIEFGSVFQFPRILRSATAAMQPPRLIVALLTVVLLIGIGRLWDASTEPTVPPTGLLGEPRTAAELSRDQAYLREAAAHYNVDLGEGHLDPAEVLAGVETTYKFRRHRLVHGEVRGGESTGGAGSLVVEEADERYFATRARIGQMLPRGAFEATMSAVVSSFNGTVQGVIYLRPQLILESWRNLFVRVPVELWQQQRWFTIVYGLLFVVFGSIGGGALCRMAACDFAGQQRLRVRDAFDFALGNWVKLLLTPSLPLAIAGGLAVVMMLMGLFMVPYLSVVGGLLYGVSIVLGFALAFLLIGYLVGLPMLLPAVACENCDAVDAQQRTYAYVVSKPLHLVGYGATALVGMALGYVVVALVAATMLNFTAGTFGTFTSNSALVGTGGFGVFDLAPDGAGAIHREWHAGWAAAMIGFWQQLVIDIVIAYVVAYIFTASTMVYLLMRRACDGQDVGEIWRPGLTPGTLVPLPRTVVHRRGESDEPGVTDRVLTGAMRRAVATRGRARKDDETEAVGAGTNGDQPRQADD
jgi:hypothetical protein